MGASETEPMEEREARHAVTESLNYTHAHQEGGQVKQIDKGGGKRSGTKRISRKAKEAEK